MNTYSWAVNQIKLQRAIDKLGANVTEEQIKAEYIRMGGLVDESKANAPQVVPDNPAVTITEEKIVIPPPSEGENPVKPKRGRKKKE